LWKTTNSVHTHLQLIAVVQKSALQFYYFHTCQALATIMPADLTANVVIGTLQVIIGILALLQRGGIFLRYRVRPLGGRRRSK
jgi:hypothetical protein